MFYVGRRVKNLKKKWKLSPAKFDIQQRLSSQLGISPAIAQVLINRGLEKEEEARDFLYGDLSNLEDPFLLKDMEVAVARVSEALRNQEKITVYGDYDVDGMTSTAILYKLLSGLGACVDYYIPGRLNEGYGLNETALEQLYQAGTRLIVSVDCGISAVSEVSQFAGKLDFVITDHHQPPAHLPPATAIINPKQLDCRYPEKNLAGVGVAFKLCQALYLDYCQMPLPLNDYLELVAIGTIADIVSLTGENRLLVKNGLRQLNQTQNIGLQALLTRCGLDPVVVDARKVGFVIAPHLNAAGRVGNAAAGVELLLTKDPVRAMELAGQLYEENLQRQAIEKEILAAADETLIKQENAWENAFVLDGIDWHPGVIGIVASRLVAKYYRPVVMISIQEGVGRGSCRSIPGFDIMKALHACSDLLLQFGGHNQAAGLSIAQEKIPEFRDRLNAIAGNTLSADDYIPVLTLDAFVGIEEIDEPFLQQVTALEPHGMGNPSPLFVGKKTIVTFAKAIGKDGKHLKLRVRHKKVAREVIAWNRGEQAVELNNNDAVYIAFSPEMNEWQGRRDIQLKAEDVLKIGEKDVVLEQALNNLAPDREIITAVYCSCRDYIRNTQSANIEFSAMVQIVRQRYKQPLGEHTLRLAVEVLAELGFLIFDRKEEQNVFSFALQNTERQDLFSSLLYQRCLKIREEYINKEIFSR
ncbi:MAG: recJ: single-stranded-DNA-specific exonuclease RecJ [Firmicutes bacterium]|nr:recJ: single-stranded-DNA-specific exonuclease RecJ [Bacillota bacterium]